MNCVNLDQTATIEDLDDVMDNWHYRLRSLKIWILNNADHDRCDKAKVLAARITICIRQIGELYNQAMLKQGLPSMTDARTYSGFKEN